MKIGEHMIWLTKIEFHSTGVLYYINPQVIYVPTSVINPFEFIYIFDIHLT